MDLQLMTTSYCRHSPFLAKEGNVLHAFPYPNIQHSIFHLFSQENIPFILAIPMRLTVSKI